MSDRRASARGKKDNKLGNELLPRKSDFAKSHKLAPGEQIDFENAESDQSMLMPPSTVSKKDPKEKNKTLMVVKNLLKENLHISNKEDTDIEQLMAKDQIKSVQENAVEDQYAKEIEKQKENLKRADSKKGPGQGRTRTSSLLNESQAKGKHFWQKKIYQNHKYKIIWDILILILAFTNFISIPIEVAWEPKASTQVTYYLFDYVLDLIFLCDIFVNFRTIVTRNDVEVTNSWKLAKLYLLSIDFYLDVLAIIQLHIILNNPVLKLVKVAKIHVTSRFTMLLRNVNLTQEWSAIAKIIWYFWLFLMYIHFLGCIWDLVIKQGEDWIPPLDWVDYTAVQYFNKDTYYQYITSYYYMVLCFGGNELGPVNPGQFGIISLFMIFASILNSLIFGEMSFLVTIISEKDTEFQVKIDTANTTMKTIDLDMHVQNEVRDYFQFTRGTLSQQEELNKFIALISPSLKIKVQRHVFLGALKLNEVLKQVQVQLELLATNPVASKSFKRSKKIMDGEDDMLQIVVNKLETQTFIPEDMVVKQDEETFSMYFIAKGECSLNAKNEHRITLPNWKILKEGDHFGEIAMIYKCKRTASVMSLNYDTLAVLGEDQFRSLVAEYPEYLKALKSYLQEYNDPLKKFKLKTIRQVEFFNNISADATHDILYNLKSTYLEKGTLLMKPDDNSNMLYFVESGCLEIYTILEGNEFILDRLYKGSALNHRSFLQEDSMYVYVRCARSVSLMQISTNQLDVIKGQHPDFEKKYLSFQNHVLRSGKSFPLDYILNMPIVFQQQQQKEILDRENTLKNLVMRRIIEVRIQKKKPKLSDVLKIMREKDLSNPKVREDFKRKFLALYDPEVQKNLKVEDVKYDKLKNTFDRIQKVVGSQQAALDSLEKRITVLQKRREEREMDPEKRARARNKLKSFKEQQQQKFQRMRMLDVVPTIREESANESDSGDEFERNERMGRTGMIKKLDEEHGDSSGEDERFQKLNKLAGKYKKEEVFGKFKSPMLMGSEHGSSEEESKQESSSDEKEAEESSESNS